jgi:hypothetical protein
MTDTLMSALTKLEGISAKNSGQPKTLATVRIGGCREAVEALKKIDAAARKRVVFAAIRAANATLVKAARAAAPSQSGALAKSIRGKVRLNKSTGAVTSLVRAKSSKAQRKKGVDAYYAHMLIGGTQPHEIPGLKKKSKTVKVELYRRKYAVFGGKVYSKVQHPGAKPNDFMESVGESAGKQAIDVFEKKFAELMEKEIAAAKAV